MHHVTRFGIWGLALFGCQSNGEGPGIDDHPLGTVLVLDQDAYDELAENAELSELGDVDPDAERAANEAALAEAEAQLESFLVEHPNVDREVLFWEVNSSLVQTRPDGNVELVSDDGQRVVYVGPQWARREYASAIQADARTDNHRPIHDALADIVPNHCRRLLPEGDDVESMTARELSQNNRALARCWEEWASFARPAAIDAPGGRRSPIIDQLPETSPSVCYDWMDYDAVSGDGNDHTWSPTAPPDNPMVRGYELFAHLPPVKNQSVRGSCPAFAAASALEFAVSRLEGAPVDISEQSLYAQGKWDMEGQHIGDGLNTVNFLEWLAATQRPIDFETVWGYNPSPCRYVPVRGEYDDSCRFYDNETCSETAHQLGLVQGPSGEVELYRPIGEAGQFVTVQDVSVQPLFEFLAGAPELVHAMNEAGWGVVVSLTLEEDFGNVDEDGFFPTEGTWPYVGGHAMHLVRVVEDDDAPGGQWWVLKNSHGQWGDNGYGYASREWFLEHVKAVTMIRPSLTVEQNQAPTIEITSPSDGYLEMPASLLGNNLNLRATTSDPDDDSCCEVTWWSTLDGHLGTGADIVGTLRGEGRREVWATARDRFGAIDQDSFTVILTNQAPEAEITRPRWVSSKPGNDVGLRVPFGEVIPLSGVAPDPNDLGREVPCEQRDWILETDLGNQLITGPRSCSFNVTPAHRGWYRVRFQARDASGAVGEDTRWIRVVDWDPADPPFLAMRLVDDLYLWNPNQYLQLRATAVSGTDEVPDVRWTARVSISGREIDLGSGTYISWRPTDDISLQCSPVAIELRAEATTEAGTTVDRVDMVLHADPC